MGLSRRSGGTSRTLGIANEKEGTFYGQLCKPMERGGSAPAKPPSGLAAPPGSPGPGSSHGWLGRLTAAGLGRGSAEGPAVPSGSCRKAPPDRGGQVGGGHRQEAGVKGGRESRPAAGFCGLAGDPGAAPPPGRAPAAPAPGAAARQWGGGRARVYSAGGEPLQLSWPVYRSVRRGALVN